MACKFTNTVEHVALDEIERQLSFNPDFYDYPVDREMIARDVLNRLPSDYQLPRKDSHVARTLSFFQRERLREIVYEAIREHIRGRSRQAHSSYPSSGPEVYRRRESRLGEQPMLYDQAGV